MNTLVRALRRHSCILLCGLVLAPVLSTAGFLDFLLPKYELEAITVTDMTPVGLLRRSPTPDQPVYFAAVSQGYVDLGGIKAGEKPIDRQVIDKTMLMALAKQGYLPATAEHQAEIALVWVWGTMNRQISPFLSSATPFNHHQMIRFLGGEKLGFASKHNDAFPQLNLPTGLVRGGDLLRLVDVARDDLYIVVISAFDLDTSSSKKPVMLWHTRVGSPSRGFWLPEAMPAMLAIASPFIGRDTPKPVWIRATDKFRPEVLLGDARLVEYVARDALPVIQVGPSN